MSHLSCTRFVPTVPAPCSSCNADRFTDPETGVAVCPDCTAFVPTDREPALTRDEALAKVWKLMLWHGQRYVRLGAAGYGTTAEEFAGEVALWFCRRWEKFNGRREHLNVFVKFMARHAAQSLRRQNPAPLGASLSAMRKPAEVVPDRAAPRDLEPDELDRLGAALLRLNPDQRAEVLAFYGAFGHRRLNGRELAQRRGRGGKQAAAWRVRTAVNRLRELLAGRA